MLHVEQQHLSRNSCHLHEGIVEPRVTRVNTDLVLIFYNAVAAHDHIITPPQEAARHNKIFLLSLVSKEFPLAKYTSCKRNKLRNGKIESGRQLIPGTFMVNFHQIVPQVNKQAVFALKIQVYFTLPTGNRQVKVYFTLPTGKRQVKVYFTLPTGNRQVKVYFTLPTGNRQVKVYFTLPTGNRQVKVYFTLPTGNRQVKPQVSDTQVNNKQTYPIAWTRLLLARRTRFTPPLHTRLTTTTNNKILRRRQFYAQLQKISQTKDPQKKRRYSSASVQESVKTNLGTLNLYSNSDLPVTSNPVQCERNALDIATTLADPLATTRSLLNQHSDQNKDMVQTTCIKSEAPSPQSSDESFQEIQEASNDSAYYKQYFEPTNIVLDENSSSNHTPSAVVHRLVPSVETIFTFNSYL
uniref:Uncharacterized protein n=1 Tax=Timema monikensis TaxID=170555 RepID=A0A7R9E9H4_9NEOP|nr:unnamed protein product [Timema monikensis]